MAIEVLEGGHPRGVSRFAADRVGSSLSRASTEGAEAKWGGHARIAAHAWAAGRGYAPDAAPLCNAVVLGMSILGFQACFIDQASPPLAFLCKQFGQFRGAGALGRGT